MITRKQKAIKKDLQKLALLLLTAIPVFTVILFNTINTFNL